jgi:hypothetical protein
VASFSSPYTAYGTAFTRKADAAHVRQLWKREDLYESHLSGYCDFDGLLCSKILWSPFSERCLFPLYWNVHVRRRIDHCVSTGSRPSNFLFRAAKEPFAHSYVGYSAGGKSGTRGTRASRIRDKIACKCAAECPSTWIPLNRRHGFTDWWPFCSRAINLRTVSMPSGRCRASIVLSYPRKPSSFSIRGALLLCMMRIIKAAIAAAIVTAVGLPDLYSIDSSDAALTELPSKAKVFSLREGEGIVSNGSLSGAAYIHTTLSSLAGQLGLSL